MAISGSTAPFDILRKWTLTISMLLDKRPWHTREHSDASIMYEFIGAFSRYRILLTMEQATVMRLPDKFPEEIQCVETTDVWLRDRVLRIFDVCGEVLNFDGINRLCPT